MLASSGMKSPVPPAGLRSVVAHVAETCLRANGPTWTLSMMPASPVPLPGSEPGLLASGWAAETPIVGQAETSVFKTFRTLAEVEHLDVLFYESTAMGRWCDGPGGPALLDLVVRPRLGVRTAQEAVRARELFRLVQPSCHVCRKLSSRFAIDPVVEVWPSREQRAAAEQVQPSSGGH